MTFNTTENTSARSDVEYRPLSSQVTNFMAESICGTLDTHQPSYHWDFVPLPELVFFVKKVTTKAKVDVYTAIASLILVGRFKDKLPENAVGEYGTTHKIFISAILTALKEFKSKSRDDYDEMETYSSSAPPTCCSSPNRCSTPSLEDLPSSSNCLDDSNSSCSSSRFTNIPESPSSDIDQPSILSTTPLSITSSMISEEDVHEMMTTNSFNYRHRRHSIINQKLADISGIYFLQDINQMEKEFLAYLGGDNILVTDEDVRVFVESNKCALGIYESIY